VFGAVPNKHNAKRGERRINSLLPKLLVIIFAYVFCEKGATNCTSEPAELNFIISYAILIAAKYVPQSPEMGVNLIRTDTMNYSQLHIKDDDLIYALYTEFAGRLSADL